MFVAGPSGSGKGGRDAVASWYRLSMRVSASIFASRPSSKPYSVPVYYEVASTTYAAVLGIVFFLPVCDRYFQHQKRWLSGYGWIAVSIIATIATAPLVITYFGQFPTYFLLTNVLISGFLPLLMGLGFLTVLMGGVPIMGPALGGVVEMLLQVLSIVCAEVASLPYAVIHGFTLTGKEIPLVLLQVGVALLFISYPAWYPALKNQGRLFPTVSSPSLS